MTDAMDIAERALDALRAAGMRVEGTRLDRLTGKDGSVVRALPSRVLAAYFDGSRREECALQFVCKSLDPVEAMAECERASRVLRDADLESANGSYALVGRPEPDGDMEELAVDAMRHVWAARLAVQIIRN